MKWFTLVLVCCAVLSALAGCVASTPVARDSSGPVVRDVIPAQEGHGRIPVVRTYSP